MQNDFLSSINIRYLIIDRISIYAKCFFKFYQYQVFLFESKILIDKFAMIKRGKFYQYQLFFFLTDKYLIIKRVINIRYFN